MNDYAFDISLPCKFLNEEWQYKQIILTHISVRPEISLHPELIDFFKLLNLRITSTEFFHRTPWPGWGTIHIDNHDNFDRARINYLIEDDSSSFLGFFKSRKDGYVAKGATGGSPIRYKNEDVDLIYKHKIKQPSVIQTGIPHGVYNPTGVRYSLGVYMSDINEGYQLTFKQAIDRFKEFIV